MWNKIYLGLLALACLVTCFFYFYANSWLGSIGSPRDALAGYYQYAGWGSTFLGVSSLVLLVVANVILWNTRSGWAMWTTFVYFTIFVVLRTFWLEKTRYNFENSETLFFTPVVGVIFVIAAGALVFFNQFINLRLNDRMYPARVEDLDVQTGADENV